MTFLIVNDQQQLHVIAARVLRKWAGSDTIGEPTETRHSLICLVYRPTGLLFTALARLITAVLHTNKSATSEQCNSEDEIAAAIKYLFFTRARERERDCPIFAMIVDANNSVKRKSVRRDTPSPTILGAYGTSPPGLSQRLGFFLGPLQALISRIITYRPMSYESYGERTFSSPTISVSSWTFLPSVRWNVLQKSMKSLNGATFSSEVSKICII